MSNNHKIKTKTYVSNIANNIYEPEYNYNDDNNDDNNGRLNQYEYDYYANELYNNNYPNPYPYQDQYPYAHINTYGYSPNDLFDEYESLPSSISSDSGYQIGNEQLKPLLATNKINNSKTLISKGETSKQENNTINIDYTSSWFETENNLSIESYLKHLFELSKKHLSSNVELDTIKAILVPHAGLQYSGLCAASAYYALRHRTRYIKNIVLLCTNHTNNNIVSTNCKYFTSYKSTSHKSNIEIDTKTIKKLEPYITIDNKLFETEHSFYMQLPFIESIAPKCRITPLIIGNILANNESTNTKDIKSVNNYKIKQIFKILLELLKNEDTVLICTSDLSHINGHFTNKINNYIYHNIRASDSEILKFLYNELNGIKTRTQIIDDIMFINNSPACGIFSMYLFAKLLNIYCSRYCVKESVSKVKSTNSFDSKLYDSKLYDSKLDSKHGKTHDTKHSKLGKHGKHSKHDIDIKYNTQQYDISGGSRYSELSANSANSANSELSITGLNSKTSGKSTNSKLKLYSRTVCYYTSIQREKINLFDFNPYQLVKVFDIPDSNLASVSYAGIIFTTQPYIRTNKSRKIEDIMSQFEKLALISLAKEKLYIELVYKSQINEYNQNYLKFPSGLISPIFSQVFSLNLGVFTTLYKQGELCGCIGTTETDNDENTIVSNVMKFIVETAFNDTRFTPVNMAEFNQIDVNITVLYKIKPITINEYFGNKFILGRDGILLTQRDKSGFFLPSVATEFKYNKKQLLEQLCLYKLGSINKDCYLQHGTQLYFNEGVEFSELQLATSD